MSIKWKALSCIFLLWLCALFMAATVLAEGMLLYGTNTNATVLKFRQWNSSMGLQQNDGTLAGAPEWIVMAASPTRNQKLAGTVYQNSAGTLGIIAVQTWNGTTWTNARNLTTTIETANDNYRSLDIKYLTDGSAIAVFSNNTENAAFAFWNGTDWTEFGSLPADNCTGTILWIETAAGANNTLYEIDLDANGDICSHAWNSTGWSATRTLETATSATSTKRIAIAAESVSGDGLAVWEGPVAGVIEYCAFDLGNSSFENGWCNNVASLADVGSANEWIQTASHPASDRIMVAMYEKSASDINAIEWNGTEFGNERVPTIIDPSAEGAGDGLAAVAYSEERALLVYGDNNADAPRFIQCLTQSACAAGNWTSAASTGMTNCGEASDLDFVALVPDSLSSKIMLVAASQASHAKCAQQWNGTAWEAGNSGLGSGVSLGSAFDIAFSYDTFQDSNSPVILLVSPQNNTLTSNATVKFTFSASDESALPECSLILNAAVNKTFYDVAPDTTISEAIPLADNTYFWNVTCRDSASHTTISATQTFMVDTQPPSWSSNASFPSSPQTYNSTAVYQFNVTWSDTTGVDKVLFESSLTGTLQNVSLVPAGNVYNYATTALAAGNYTWRQLANDSLGNKNTTNTFAYTVLKATPSLVLLINPAATVEHGAFTNVTCNSGTNQVTPSLFRNNASVANPDIATLAAGSYEYTCTNTETQNMSAALTTLQLNVTPASPAPNQTSSNNQNAESSGGGGGRSPAVLAPSQQTTTPLPAECIEDWVCTVWSNCTLGVAVRDCVETAGCGTSKEMPPTIEACEEPDTLTLAAVETPATGKALQQFANSLISGFAIASPTTEELTESATLTTPSLLKWLLNTLLLSATIAAFLSLYFAPKTQVQEGIRAYAAQPATLVPSEFVADADAVLEFIFFSEPNEAAWQRLGSTYSPIVIETCRNALQDNRTFTTEQAQPNISYAEYEYIDYPTFAAVVRALARAKTVKSTAKETLCSARDSASATKRCLSNAIDAPKNHGLREVSSAKKVPVTRIALRSKKEAAEALSQLRQGACVILADVTLLGKDRQQYAAILKQLRRTAQIHEGCILGIGEGSIIVTSQIPIEKQYANRKKGGADHGAI